MPYLVLHILKIFNLVFVQQGLLKVLKEKMSSEIFFSIKFIKIKRAIFLIGRISCLFQKVLIREITLDFSCNVFFEK